MLCVQRVYKVIELLQDNKRLGFDYLNEPYLIRLITVPHASLGKKQGYKGSNKTRQKRLEQGRAAAKLAEATGAGEAVQPRQTIDLTVEDETVEDDTTGGKLIGEDMATGEVHAPQTSDIEDDYRDAAAGIKAALARKGRKRKTRV